MNVLHRLPRALTVVVMFSIASAAFSANDKEPVRDSKVNDAWLKGKVEMALLLNRHLNGFKIDTYVDSSVVTLNGEVTSDIDRDLAEQIALGVDGVSTVDNNLAIAPEEKLQAGGEHEQERQFLQRMEDLTTTAQIKSKFLMNKNITGRHINVGTVNAVVTLQGSVNSAQERDLVVHIAKNTGKVTGVKDELKITASQANR